MPPFLLSAETYIDQNGYQRYLFNGKLVHREVASKKLGRRLRPGEVVHHIDRNKTNNDPSNLWVFPSQEAHDRAHRYDARRYGWKASYCGYKKSGIRTGISNVHYPNASYLPNRRRHRSRSIPKFFLIILITALVIFVILTNHESRHVRPVNFKLKRKSSWGQPIPANASKNDVSVRIRRGRRIKK